MATPSPQRTRQLVQKRPQDTDKTLRLVVRIFVLAALMLAAFYLAMRGHEIVALLISLPVTVIITVAVAYRFLRR
jgi:hypothetical protein